MADGIQINIPVLDITVDRYAAFKSWKSQWEDYAMLSGLSEKEKEFQAAMMRYAFSAETRTIYESLNLSTEDRKDPEKVIKAME